MKLTAFTDYNLRVLIYLAAKRERRATIAEICAAFNLKENHLTKVVHHLGKCGWVETTRGKGGGLFLAKPAENIHVGHVVRDAEGQAMPAECFATEPSSCAIVSCCRLKGVLAEAVKAFYEVLDRHTLADITRNPQELATILHFHRPTNPATALQRALETMSPSDVSPYPYSGPEELRAPILAALHRVVDPEVAMTIVDVGLVYGVTVTPERLHVLLTMTSAACPVADVIIDDVGTELDKVAPAEMAVDVELVWEPPWTTDRMSARAKAFMGW